MRIAVIDLETDPFKFNRLPIPFAAGFYDGKQFRYFWGSDCIKQLLAFLKAYPEKLVIYAHNGGKFDYWYMAHEIKEPLLYIDSRLCKGGLFHHEIRDSYKILPVPLASIQKDDIDYACMERRVREKHKEKIIDYLRGDCVYLYDAVQKFIDRFGNVLTIGGAALKELNKHYRIDCLSPGQDGVYRQFYHGGRCEVFEVGELVSSRGWKLYDVNGLYPYCEKEYEHPNGAANYVSDVLPDAPFYLAHIICKSRGAFPVQTKGGLTFPHGDIETFTTSHELRMAQKLGLVEILKVIGCYAWTDTQNFRVHVDEWAAYKIESEKAGDMTGRAIGKLIPNNSYGKTAQNPTKFREYKLFPDYIECEKAGYSPAGTLGKRTVGSRPAPVHPRMYKNVAVAASVTGAARSVWMHAWACAERPAAGDTDSLWCEHLPLQIDPYKLGAWKLEAECDVLYIAGKKMYAAWKENYNEPRHKSRTKNKYIEGFYKIDKGGHRMPLKMASKGVRMRPEDVARVARGEILRVPIEAPSLRIGQKEKFLARDIARTARLV